MTTVVAINFGVVTINLIRCLSRVCKFFHCAANTLIFSGFEAKNVKASGAEPQAPMGELTALPHTPLLVSGWAPPPAAPPTIRPPYSPIPRSATVWVQSQWRIQELGGGGAPARVWQWVGRSSRRARPGEGAGGGHPSRPARGCGGAL